MTAQILTTDLTCLIQESRRKNIDLRNAAEKSLADLKALPNTSEAQLAADLKRRPNFLRPFLLACGSRNSRFAGYGISCLQRMIVVNGLPQAALKAVLDAFQECSSLGLDIQLKVLQVLPTLLQNYASHLTGELLAAALNVCFLLYGSKIVVVTNTAAATLRQLVLSVIERVAAEDENRNHSVLSGSMADIPMQGDTITIESAARDGCNLLNDLCLMTEGSKPQFLPTATLSQEFGLELIESMIANHADTVASHPEHVNILRLRLMPLLIRIISEPANFPATVRAMRVLPIIFGSLLNVLATECEMALSLLNHLLDPDAAASWKRTLCMEVFRNLYAEPLLIRSIYAHFDEQDGQKNIIADNMATLVRIIAEKPSLVGLGQQSSIPLPSQIKDSSGEQLALQADSVAGSIGIGIVTKSLSAPGLSSQWSIMRVPCLEQLDKLEPPSIPSTYIYSLALSCLNSFSDGLARFILPFTMAADPRSRRKQHTVSDLDDAEDGDLTQDLGFLTNGRREVNSKIQSSQYPKLPVNPLSLIDHVLYSQICTSAQMIDTCWPALLAACSTFFKAALDSEHYHSLVRSFQKFTQVAGLLRLSTPRDAFLTTLGKNAVPPAVIPTHTAAVSSTTSLDKKQAQRRTSGIQAGESNYGSSLKRPLETPQQSTELGATKINIRNLLCLRALLNLAIALGPVLEGAWSIILETLQQADLVITQMNFHRRQKSGNTMTKPERLMDSGDVNEFEAEITAVETAAARMLESSCDLPKSAFLKMVTSFSKLLRDIQEDSHITADGPQDAAVSSIPGFHSHRRSSSVFIGISSPALEQRRNAFVLENLSRLAELNLPRLLQNEPGESGWTVITDIFLSVIGRQALVEDLRLHAAGAISNLVQATGTSAIPIDRKDEVRRQGLDTLEKVIDALYNSDDSENKAIQSCETEIHRLSLEALRSALEQYGNTLVLGWDCVFTIIGSVFVMPNVVDGKDTTAVVGSKLPSDVRARPSRLLRSSFGSLQLVCSDFLSVVPQSSIPILLRAVHSFCAQKQDFNISLTSTTLFWNLSDHIWQGTQESSQCSDGNNSGDGLTVATDRGKLLEEKSKTELWLTLLNALVETTTDSRVDIRHSALHTLFRVLHSSGATLNPRKWMTYLELVVSRMLSANESEYQVIDSRHQTDQASVRQNWNESAILMLDGVARLWEQHLKSIISCSSFADLWEELMAQFQAFIDRRALDVSTSVFSTMTRILTEVGNVKESFTVSIKSAWEIWQNSNPVEHKDISFQSRNDNQSALMAYLQLLKAMYAFIEDDIDLNKVQLILDQLRVCAEGLGSNIYYKDMDTMTPVQTKILEIVSSVRVNVLGTSAAIIDTVAFFANMAHERDVDNTKRGGLTYVAMSKAAMDLLGKFILDNIHDQDLCHSSAISRAIGTLATSARLKYQWHSTGKEPLIWKKATTISVDILNAFLPTFREISSEGKLDTSFWKEVLALFDGIVSAECNTPMASQDISMDQDFDIAAFGDIRDLLNTFLGLDYISDQVRRTYAETIFRNSIVHEPHPDDLAEPGHDLLDGLISIHIGRTQDLPPSPRAKLSYVLLDELFDLVAMHDSSIERVKMAQAAAPFLILRAGVVLKAYILDQPLRGLMPQPISQKREMLYILDKLINLDSEPTAILDTPGVNSEHKKHLHRLYSLIVKALRAARRDERMQEALTSIIEAVGEDFDVYDKYHRD